MDEKKLATNNNIDKAIPNTFKITPLIFYLKLVSKQGESCSCGHYAIYWKPPIFLGERKRFNQAQTNPG